MVTNLLKDWDHQELRSPAQPDTPIPIIVSEKIPIAQVMLMAVEIPTTVTARTDSFIDNLIRVFLGTPDNRKQELHAFSMCIVSFHVMPQ
jgi:hypothetical protein